MWSDLASLNFLSMVLVREREAWMKSDLDRLMEERNLQAFLVMGSSGGNPVMNYLTGGAHLENALVVKRRGGPLTLVHGSMERDTAAATGLALVDRDQTYNQYQFLQKHEGDPVAAAVDYLGQVIRDQQLLGRLGVYGMVDAGSAMTLLTRLQDESEGVELVGEYGTSLFSLARETKDDWEIGELREAGRLTCMVIGEVQEFIQGHRTRDEMVVKSDGTPLTIGDVKSFLRMRCMVHGLTEHQDTIFSQGRDAGVPHNRGDEAMALRLGQSIIYDFFPVVASGYYHDVTRTWSLGYATDEVQKAWDECKEVFDKSMAAIQLGVPYRDLQILTCEYFESKGHPTPMNHPGTHIGYVHSLGHGIGLDIHEEPRLSASAGNTTKAAPGHVFSVEPGLYYPERGFGVRIEDSVAFTEAGQLINLTDYPYDLVIPMK
jgi:Xaa-Pro aminopeptidase